jgi:stage II sporulation protein AA (anti-sigma F factor antagonist)
MQPKIDTAPRERARLQFDTAGSILSVRVRGEIDHHTASDIRRGIDTVLFEKRPKKLLLDLSAVSFMDSSGLGLIMGRYSVMKELEGEMVVWNPSPEIRSIITLAGMERMVRIEYPADSDRAPTSPVKADRPRRSPAPRRPATQGTAAQETTPPRTSPRKRKKSPAPANDPEGADRKEREA